MDPPTKAASEKLMAAMAKVVPPPAAFEKLAATMGALAALHRPVVLPHLTVSAMPWWPDT